MPVARTNPIKASDDAKLLIQAIVDYAIYRVDLNGIVISWNPGAERTKGYAEHEILGCHFSRFFTPQDQAAGKPARSLAIARQAGRFEEDDWRVRKDGSCFWASVVIDAIYDENGALAGYAKVTRDLSERRIIEEALHDTERRFRLLMDSVVHYAIYTLDPDGFVTSWNPGAERAKGYTAEQILGQNFAEFYSPEDRAAGKPGKALATARTERRFEEEGWRVRKDGSRFWANVVIEPMFDEHAQLIGFAKVTRDISDKLILEQAKEQLYQAQKMETVGQLTGGVAHDFNNLLAVVIGSLELIATANDNPRIRRLVDTALRASERGAKLTSQLLAFSRRQVLRPQTSSINDLITNFEDLLRQAGKQGIHLQLDLLTELWPSDIDQAQFQSALLNLVVNARDAMESGGTLTVETRNVAIDALAAAELTDIAAGDYIEIVVRDTGAGMTPDVLARAIEPFYTTKDIGLGSGLGLSQVYGFVRQSNGQMHIVSAVGKGTSISIYLPRSTLQVAGDADPSGLSSEAGLGTVLVVEDDPDVLDTAIEAIRSFGYNVHYARNGSEAMEILAGDVAFDLLFTDVVMQPKMNGVELARHACQLRPDLRVLLASGYPREALGTRGDEEETAMEFIAKPYTLSALSEKLGSLRRTTAY